MAMQDTFNRVQEYRTTMNSIGISLSKMERLIASLLSNIDSDSTLFKNGKYTFEFDCLLYKTDRTYLESGCFFYKKGTDTKKFPDSIDKLGQKPDVVTADELYLAAYRLPKFMQAITEELICEILDETMKKCEKIKGSAIGDLI